MRKAMFILGVAIAATAYCAMFLYVISTIDPLMWHRKFYTIEFNCLLILLAGIYIAWASRKKKSRGGKQ